MQDQCCNVNVNETITTLRYDHATKGLVYRNEAYHTSGSGETNIPISEFTVDTKLEDLGNVKDGEVKGCGILAHRSKCIDCKECPDCENQTCEHEWYQWQAKDAETTSPFKYLAGFTEDGCLVAIPAPTSGISTIVGKNGKWSINNTELPNGVDPNTVFPAIGNKNIYGVNNDLRTPDKSTFIATHPLNRDVTGDLAFTSKTPGS